jgi:hypothetical protein
MNRTATRHVVSSGSALSDRMPPGALEAFTKDYAGTFNARVISLS